MRQPVPSAAPPLQLPNGAVIDLPASGLGAGGYEFRPLDTDTDDTNPMRDNRPVIILFSPNGSVERIYWGRDRSKAVRGSYATLPISLLVGRRENIVSSLGRLDLTEDPLLTPEQTTQLNVLDLGNVWITLNPQSGLVGVTENAVVVPPVDFDYNNPIHRANALFRARDIAREGQSMGGR